MNNWKIAATKITMENHWNLQKIARKETQRKHEEFNPQINQSKKSVKLKFYIFTDGSHAHTLNKENVNKK